MAAIASRTAFSVSGRTKRVPFSTWLTVESETPAIRATSAMVAIRKQP